MEIPCKNAALARSRTRKSIGTAMPCSMLDSAEETANTVRPGITVLPEQDEHCESG